MKAKIDRKQLSIVRQNGADNDIVAEVELGDQG